MKRSFGTHDGTFHADEVTACAILLFLNKIDRDKVMRSRDPKKLSECEYVCDVGGIYDPAAKRFDHHQNEYQGELSSAGMVWKFLRESGDVDARTYNYFNHALLWGVDAVDNGRAHLEIGMCTFSQVISNFVPPEYDLPEEDLDAAFFQAVDFACGHLKRLWERHRYIESCRQAVEAAMQPQREVLIFDKAMPWMDLFFDMGGEEHPALFLIMPSHGHWKLRGIPPNSREKMQVRKPLPKEWAGLMDDELKKASGIKGAVFCHKGRFISVWETKEDALKAAEYVLRKKA
jgi:uncharacterized UPF0160 family protein